MNARLVGTLLVAAILGGVLAGGVTTRAEAQNTYLWTAGDVEVNYDPTADLAELEFSIAVTVSVQESDENDSFPHDTLGFAIESPAYDDEAITYEFVAELSDNVADRLVFISYFETEDSVGAVGLYSPPNYLALEEDTEFYTLEFSTDAEFLSNNVNGVTINLEFDTFGNRISDGDGESETIFSGGSITLNPVLRFLRGDVDGNGTVSAVVDSIALLEFGFIPGSAVPPCADAADFDDSGVVSPLTDSFALLLWAFSGGAPPPAPGAFSCGIDLTGDRIGCTTAAEACE